MTVLTLLGLPGPECGHPFHWLKLKREERFRTVLTLFDISDSFEQFF